MSDLRTEVNGLMRQVAEQAEDARMDERERRREMDALLRSVMELADSLERVRSTAQPADTEALQALAMQVQELLADQGLVAFRPPVGDAVDATDSEVIAAVTNRSLRPGTVTAVIRPGYRSGERMVRPAGVEIVKEQE